jgi:hypothetical protein
MANTQTLTGFTELIYEARDIVLREPIGFASSVLVNSGSEGVSLNGTVKSFVAGQPTLNTDHTPAMTVPAGDDMTSTVEEMTIGQVARINIPLKGETVRQLDNTVGRQNFINNTLAQGIRQIVNAIEAHVGTVAKNGASRALGTAGTTPFAGSPGSHALIPQVNQILTDNGAPNDGQRTLVLSTTAATNLKVLSNIYKVNENGSAETLRNGVLLDIDGVSIKQSKGVAAHTKGAGASYVINNGNITVGSTTISVDGGTVNTTGFQPGDIVTIADEPTAGKYVVKTGLTSTAGNIVIANPGLTGAIVDGKAVTIGASYTGNALFHRSAIELVVRPPAMPDGGDLAEDRMTVFDPNSGLVFEVALYKGYGMNLMEIVCYYQAKVWKPELVATLLG